MSKQVLIVTSKVKQLVKQSADMQTSAAVIDVLSEHVEFIMKNSINEAKADGRKTVMERDVRKALGQ